MINIHIHSDGSMNVFCDCETIRSGHAICERCRFRVEIKIAELLNSKWKGVKRYNTKTI